MEETRPDYMVHVQLNIEFLSGPNLTLLYHTTQDRHATAVLIYTKPASYLVPVKLLTLILHKLWVATTNM